MDLTSAPAGLGPARVLDPAAYGGAHHAPRWALRPSSREELVEAVKAAARDKLRMIPWGGPPAEPLGDALPPYDLALDLSALDRVVEYEPEDLTLTAECGATLGTLRATLAARGQELPLEAMGGDGVTLGGVIATNGAGPRRLRFGAPRDRVLGARFVLADGTFARSGGKVVKNVAGYGIHRLLCGSRGGLAIVIEASLKLMPAPAARVALAWSAPSPLRLRDRTLALSLARLEPAVIWLAGDPRRPALTIALEDDAPWVDEQVATITTLLGAPDERREGDAARALVDTLPRIGHDNPATMTRVAFTTGERLLSALAALDGLAGVTRFTFDALAGRLTLALDPAEAHSSTQRLGERDFIPDVALGVDSAVSAQVSVRALRARIRQALDPDRLLALGDRWERGELGA